MRYNRTIAVAEIHRGLAHLGGDLADLRDQREADLGNVNLTAGDAVHEHLNTAMQHVCNAVKELQTILDSS